MNIPTLLTVGNTQTIPDATFDDLQLRRLLTEKTIHVLSHPAGKEELLARQELFSYMRDASSFARIKEVYMLLKEYERAVRVWRASSVEVEKRFLFCEMLEQYVTICSALSSLSDFGQKLRAAAEYWGTALAAQTTISEDIAKLRALLTKLGTFNISFGERAYMTCDDVPVTINAVLKEAAQALELDMPEHRISRIRINDALSHAVSELFSAALAEYDALCESYMTLHFDAPAAYIAQFDFFFSILTLCDKADEYGIPICFPTVSERRQYKAEQVYDISLFLKNTGRIVPNDTYFAQEEPFFFITGANGGGKTTYLRASGINLILFLGGCPVFARAAEIYPFRAVCSHFPADERFSDGGRLQDEKKRVDDLLSGCDADTFIVFNETYSGTDDKLGCEMTLDTASAIREKGSFGLFVTHFHEVRAGGWPMLNTVIEEDEYHQRTFRIVRDFGITSSFAEDILRKYKLDAASLAERGRG